MVEDTKIEDGAVPVDESTDPDVDETTPPIAEVKAAEAEMRDDVRKSAEEKVKQIHEGQKKDGSMDLKDMDLETAFLVVVTKDGRVAAIHNPDMSSTGHTCRPATVHDIQHASEDLVDDLRAVRMSGIISRQLGAHLAGAMKQQTPSLRDRLASAGQGMPSMPGIGVPGVGKRPR